jgi:hypothetical protein
VPAVRVAAVPFGCMGDTRPCNLARSMNSLGPFMKVGIHMGGTLSIAELCAEYAALATALVDLDRRIQALSRASLEDTRCDAITLSAVASIAQADDLWAQLDDILSRQNAIVVALIDQAVGNARELRDKGQILAMLLQTNRPTKDDLADALSLSLVRDIMSLFP